MDSLSPKSLVIKALKKNLQALKDSGMTHIPRQEKTVFKGTPLVKIREEIGDCTRCKLSQGRTKIVFGTGNPSAALMFIGEGPGHDEDIQGEPFVGRAGQLLTKIIEAMGLKRSDVYIANVVKCRPPNNRTPEPDEIATCSPFLIKQVLAIGPKVIVTLGNPATQTLLETQQGVTSLRGRFFNWQGVSLMPTYHPAFLLRNPNMKKPVWEDMQKVMEKLGLKLKQNS
ncbi:MAG: uracil-DNA glycosylase [Deltaproteobacteria bacterium]|nr:uracil-DNA glycosylase [Deltaproteobacteria bacterium]